MDMANIRSAAAEYARIAKVHGDQMRRERAAYLNTKGRQLQAFYLRKIKEEILSVGAADQATWTTCKFCVTFFLMILVGVIVEQRRV